eukprot:4096784-Prymnesium_polylepis.1
MVSSAPSASTGSCGWGRAIRRSGCGRTPPHIGYSGNFAPQHWKTPGGPADRRDSSGRRGARRQLSSVAVAVLKYGRVVGRWESGEQ